MSKEDTTISNELTLSNGDKIVLREFLSRKIYKEIQKRTWSENPNIEGGKIDKVNLNILAITDAEDYTVFAMIEKITDKNGEVKEKTPVYIEELSLSDFNSLRDKINLITNPKTDKEKKTSIPQSQE